jgi:nicotinate-nucleotide pyrophosphorylase (carboxylating)
MDIGTGDVTSALPPDTEVDWFIEAQASGVLAGVGAAAYVLEVEPLVSDGTKVERGTKVLEGTASAPWLLQRERTALNVLMHLSGVATLAAQFVAETTGCRATIVDTRKTLPGLRQLQKYAVRCGGGRNHRMGLYDAVMLKDNHIAAYGGITGAVKEARNRVGHMMKIEVEADRLDQVQEAVEAGADVVLLDNMSIEQMTEAVSKYQGKVILEASGGINLQTVRAVALTGVDIISVGALTHSAVALPFHLELLG